MGEQHSQEVQSLLQKNQKLQQSIMDLSSAIRLNKKNRFATTSQKTRHSSQKDERPTRDEERENHDGTLTSAPSAPSEADVEVEATTEAVLAKEDREIAALQSDAYNVYMFIDKELANVTHLCCLAHARAKFKEALEQGKDERARLFFDCIELLYGYEAEYRRSGLSPDEVRLRRNDSRTADVMIRMSTELNRLLNNPQSHLGDMMAEVSAVYYTFISTCSMLGVSAQTLRCFSLQ